MENTVKYIEIDGIRKSIGGNADKNARVLCNRDFGRFIINQRNIVANTPFSTVGKYFIDRWILADGTATITSDGLQVNGTVIQKLEHSLEFENTPDILKMYSGTANASYDEETNTFILESNGGIISRIYTPLADYGEELLKCKRYFYRMNNTTVLFIGLIIDWDSQGGFLNIGLNPEMRIAPTITVSNPATILSLPGFANQCSLTPMNSKKGNATFYCETIDPQITDNFISAKYARFGTNSTYIDFDAEL